MFGLCLTRRLCRPWPQSTQAVILRQVLRSQNARPSFVPRDSPQLFFFSSHATPSESRSSSTPTPLSSRPSNPQFLPVLIVGNDVSALTLARALELAGVPWLLLPPAIPSSSSIHERNIVMEWSGPMERILDALKLGDTLRARSRRVEGMGYRTSDGRWLTHTQPREQAPPCVALRSSLALQQVAVEYILRESLPQNRIAATTAAGSASFHSFDSDPISGTVTVRLTDGSSFTGSLLVAADGIDSAIRQQLFPDIQPRYAGYGYWQASVALPDEAFRSAEQIASEQESAASCSFVQPGKASSECAACTPSITAEQLQSQKKISSDADRAAAIWRWSNASPDHAWESWGCGTRIAFVPLPGRQVFWSLSRKLNQRDAEAIASKQASGERLGIPDQGDLHWHAPIDTLIAATSRERIEFQPIREISLPSSRWTNATQRVVLIGNAVHALPPNVAAGTMLAMQDAVELAAELRLLCQRQQQQQSSSSNCGINAMNENGTFSTNSLSHALTSYVNTRRTSVTLVQAFSGLLARAGQYCNPKLASTRDAILLAIPDRLRNFLFRQLQKLYLGWTYTVPELGSGVYESCMRAFSYEAWDNLPPLVREYISPTATRVHHSTGRATCTVGSSALARFARKMVGMPPQVVDAEMRLIIEQDLNGEEVWTRIFTKQGSSDHVSQQISPRLITRQYAEEDCMVESMELIPARPGLLQFEVKMHVEPLVHPESGKRGLHHTAQTQRLRLLQKIPLFRRFGGRGGFVIPIPSFAQPLLQTETLAHEATKDKPAHVTFNIRVTAPSIPGLSFLMGGDRYICGYKGDVTWFDKPEVRKWLGSQPTTSVSPAAGATAIVR